MKEGKKISYRNLIILIVAIILLIIIGITITMARYKSQGNTVANAEIAFYVLKEGYQQGNIMLANLYPSEDPFEYEFTITNTDGTNVAETSLEYSIELQITTNLPLEIEIYKNDTKLTNADDIENNVVLDESGQCYIRNIKINNGSFTFNQSKTDVYRLSAEFPIEYSAIEEYEGVIDNVAITLESKQKI